MLIGGFSIWHLTDFPRIFYDEGITIEIARNTALFGTPDILIAPNTFSGLSYFVGSSGYPVTAPLALFFKIFSIGFAQARLYALGWFLAFLITIFFTARRWFSAEECLWALLLLATFAPLHDHARRVLGDVPGLVLFILGIILLFVQKRTFLAGILFGLATVAKPSIFIPIAPALAITFFITRRPFRELVRIALAMAIPIVIWLLISVPDPLTATAWKRMFTYYANPYGTAYPVLTSVLDNLRRFFTHTTLMYFAVLGSIVITIGISIWRRHRHPLIFFLFTYSGLVFLFFMRSAGFFRYLLPIELMILIALPATGKIALTTIQPKIPLIKKIPPTVLWRGILVILVLLQGVQFFFFSNSYSGGSEVTDIKSVIDQQKTGTIGVINSPQVAWLSPPDRTFQYLWENEFLIIGTNPLDAPRNTLPTLIILPSDPEQLDALTTSQRDTLKRYELIFEKRWAAYRLKTAR